MSEIIALALKMLLPFVGYLFQRAAVSNELKQSFFEFVQKYEQERAAISGAKETGKKQDADLDAQLQAIDEGKK